MFANVFFYLPLFLLSLEKKEGKSLINIATNDFKNVHTFFNQFGIHLVRKKKKMLNIKNERNIAKKKNQKKNRCTYF